MELHAAAGHGGVDLRNCGYNAPNALSIELDGSWSSFFIDCRDEYLSAKKDVIELVDNKGTLVAEKNTTGYMTTMSPFMSPSVRRGPHSMSPRQQYSKVSQSDYGSIEGGGVALKPIKNKNASFNA